MRVVLLTLLIAATLGNSAFAGWNEAALEYSEKYNFEIEDTFLSTVWGSCHSPNPSYQRMSAKVFDWDVVSDDLYHRTLPTKLGLVENERGQTKKAPVVFFIPGAFSNIDEKMPKHFMDRFTKLGYHTMVVPNPWGTDYVSRKPKTITGHIEAEAQVLYDVFKRGQRYLEDQGLSNGEYHIVGVSYGAFLSAMISALDAEALAPIGFESATIISPPLQLGAALNNLDSILEETIDYTTMWLPKIARKYLSLCRFDLEERGDYSFADARGLAAAQGFHVELIKSLRLYDRLWDLETIPRDFWSRLRGDYRRWRVEMTFSKYFRTYNRSASEIVDSERGGLGHYLNIVRDHSETRIQVLLASDDFLNSPDEMKNLEYELSHDELIELETGGHFGFRALPWFDLFLERAFTKSP